MEPLLSGTAEIQRAVGGSCPSRLRRHADHELLADQLVTGKASCGVQLMVRRGFNLVEKVT
jgi:hypothetical protein